MSEGIKKSTFKVGVLSTTNYDKPVSRKRPEGSEEYMSARAEKLRELYEKMEPLFCYLYYFEKLQSLYYIYYSIPIIFKKKSS